MKPKVYTLNRFIKISKLDHQNRTWSQQRYHKKGFVRQRLAEIGVHSPFVAVGKILAITDTGRPWMGWRPKSIPVLEQPLLFEKRQGRSGFGPWYRGNRTPWTTPKADTPRGARPSQPAEIAPLKSFRAWRPVPQSPDMGEGPGPREASWTWAMYPNTNRTRVAICVVS